MKKIIIIKQKLKISFFNINIKLFNYKNLKTKLTSSLKLIKTYQEQLLQYKNIEIKNEEIQTIPTYLFNQTIGVNTDNIKKELTNIQNPIISYDNKLNRSIIKNDLITLKSNNKQLSFSEFTTLSIIPTITKIKPNSKNKYINKKNKTIKPNIPIQQISQKNQIKTRINQKKTSQINPIIIDNTPSSLDLISNQSSEIGVEQFNNHKLDEEVEFSSSESIDSITDDLTLLNASYDESSMMISLWDLVSDIENNNI